MYIFHIGTFTDAVWECVKQSYRAVYPDVKGVGAFTEMLFNSVSYDDNSDYTLHKSTDSRLRKSKENINQKVVTRFNAAGARDDVIASMESNVIPHIAKGRVELLKSKLAKLLQMDTTIDTEYKEKLIADMGAGQLAESLADMLILAVNTEHANSRTIIPSNAINLPAANDWFTGRESYLSAIAENFANGSRIQIVCGTGGIGKTQIAQQYVHSNYSSYSEIHWIYADSIDGIVQAYCEILSEKNIPPENQGAKTVCQAYQKYMDSRMDWLIIYDNANYYTDESFNDFVQLCLPKNTRTGNIIITTRNNRPIGKAEIIEIDLLTEEESKDFLMIRTNHNDEAGAIQLAKRLVYYPLALELAGAYIRATPNSSFKKYISYLDKGKKMLNIKNNVTDYHETIRELLLITLGRIKNDYGSEIGRIIEDLLHIFSYENPYYLDLFSLCYLHSEQNQDLELLVRDILHEGEDIIPRLIKLSDFLRDEINQDLVASILMRYGLVHDGQSECLAMNEVQQEVFRDYIFDDRDWSMLVIASYTNMEDSTDENYQLRARINKSYAFTVKGKFLLKDDPSDFLKTYQAHYCFLSAYREMIISITSGFDDLVKAHADPDTIMEAYSTMMETFMDMREYFGNIEDCYLFTNIVAIFILVSGYIRRSLIRNRFFKAALAVIVDNLDILKETRLFIKNNSDYSSSIPNLSNPVFDNHKFNNTAITNLYEDTFSCIIQCCFYGSWDERLLPHLESLPAYLDYGLENKYLKNTKFVPSFKKVIKAYIKKDLLLFPDELKKVIENTFGKPYTEIAEEAMKNMGWS